MANTAVTAIGPIGFTDAGEQFVIPLNDLHFDPSATLATGWPLYAQHKGVVDGLLQYLQQDGLVTPAPKPPPAAAMVITAATSGSTGNDVMIAFSNVREDPVTHETVFDATLTQTDVYLGFTPATIADVLGKSSGRGTRPGLVFVSSSGQPNQPANGNYTLTGGPPYTVDILDDQSNKAFTVRSRGDDADAANTIVTISAADDPNNPGTFTLTATWTKQVTGIQPGDLQSSYEYEITVAPPPGGQLLVPAPGAVALRGGSDVTGPSTASVTVSAQ